LSIGGTLARCAPGRSRICPLGNERDSASVASPQVQQRRARKTVPGGLPLHDYANLYIDARNPVMYVLRGGHLDLCVLRVSLDVLDLPGTVIADGNAADHMTYFDASPDGLATIDRDMVLAASWMDPNPEIYCEKKRVRCAEVLVPYRVAPQFVLGAYVSCARALGNLRALNLTEPPPAYILERLFFLR
jgi:hypothetical protein